MDALVEAVRAEALEPYQELVKAAREVVREHDARNEAFGFQPEDYQTIPIAVNVLRLALDALPSEEVRRD